MKRKAYRGGNSTIPQPAASENNDEPMQNLAFEHAIYRMLHSTQTTAEILDDYLRELDA